jgi:hypothetical protein
MPIPRSRPPGATVASSHARHQRPSVPWQARHALADLAQLGPCLGAPGSVLAMPEALAARLDQPQPAGVVGALVAVKIVRSSPAVFIVPPG